MHFSDGLEHLEAAGVVLASQMSGRLRSGGLSSPPSGGIPEGPGFRYEAAPSFFLGRRGLGPLRVAWDTNIVIDYLSRGDVMWSGHSVLDGMEAEHGEQVEALQLVLAVWVLRDIRFQIPACVIEDSKRKPLHPRRRKQRLIARCEFQAAVRLLDDDSAESDEMNPPLILPRQELEHALLSVPAGNDRGLVREAVMGGNHVFLTRDPRVVSARDALRPFGLLIATPGDLLEHLAGCQRTDCLMHPRYLYWPMPDQRRVANLLLARRERNHGH